MESSENMYLKEIEILGFKSFADKITISLDDNITCIVGPNGSGKSNIVDAIRWVLGEQSVKSLRGDNLMSDIIFAGSKSRNALNVASVTLTFDNNDQILKIPYNTVSVKRRLYKTGENEYFLNGEKCRLKDITELFLDTNVSKHSFNIISQGEISRIISNSPIERRSIVEEAAGILKYKTRREEATKKLERTISNIDRINDIIGELEGRIEPLKEQSDKAKEYLEVKDKLKEIEVGLLVNEIEEIETKYQNNKNRVEILNKEIITLNTNISNSENEELKVKEIGIEKELDELNSRLVTLTKEEEKLFGERNIIKERSKYNADDLKVHENISLLNDNKIKFEKELELFEQELSNLQQELNLRTNHIDELTKSLQDKKTKKDNLYKEYNYKNKKYLENNNRLNIIKDNLDNNGTINSSVKRVLNNPKLNGICDAFGNILEVENKFSKALEVIISPIKNNIIVDNELSAKEAINYLKNNSLGRATFFPISVIKPRGIDLDTLDILEREIDYLGVLSDKVTCQDKYHDIVLNQLGNIVIVRDLDSGNRISKAINKRYKIVTLDGEIINIGGSITGGSINNLVSPISLRNELKDLVLENNTLENVLKELLESVDNLEKEINVNENELYKEKTDGFHLQELINNNESLYISKKEELEQVNKELNSLKKLTKAEIGEEEKQINDQYYAKKNEKELLTKEIVKVNKEKDNIKNHLLELEAQDKLNNSTLKLKEKELKDLELEISKMDFKMDNNLNILNEDYEMTYEKARDEFALYMDLNEARKQVNNYKNKLKDIGMVNILSIDEFNEVNERYTFLTSQRDDLLNAKDTLYSIIDEMDEIMKEDFVKTFRELDVEFKKVFAELFKGGNAALKLTDSDNILETGIDIVACPPGKSLKSISLLSGGEKTLTAISLLFAILNIRRVPFCIFDEIEAALDEANVDIFGHYLNHYQDKTQFLLITHKKRTMEYAKTLYGITMQESGVSKLVSVHLD